MTGIRDIVPPARGEVIVDTGGACQPRFQNFVEDITSNVKALSEDIINLEGTTQVVISGTYQSTGNQVIICDNIATITLDPAAIDGTKVKIKRTNGLVTITAIASIDDSSEDLLLSRDQTGVDLVFISESASWYLF